MLFLIIFDEVLVHDEVVHAVEVVVVVLLVHASIHVLATLYIDDVVLIDAYYQLLPLQGQNFFHLELGYMFHVLTYYFLLFFLANTQLGVHLVNPIVDFPGIKLLLFPEENLEDSVVVAL